MKRVLLGTTTLVAAGAFAAGAAQADEMMDEGINIGLSGYYNAAFISYSGDDDDGIGGQGVDQNVEMQLVGSTTLDNGITVGVSIDFRPGSSDDSQATLSGPFGTLAYGNFGSAARDIPGAPWGNALFNVNGAWFAPQVGGGTVEWKGIDTGGGDPSGFADKATKVAYFSPSFNGLSLGVSFAPESSKGFYNSRQGTSGDQSEQIALGLNFSQEVMGGIISAAITHESHETVVAKKCNDMKMNCDPDVLRFGASLAVDDITIGGGYVEGDEKGSGVTTLVNAGIAYSMGSASVDFGWANSSSDHASKMDKDGANSTIYSIGAGYNLGPGIALAGALQFGTDENGATDSKGKTIDNDWVAVLIGTSINF